MEITASKSKMGTLRELGFFIFIALAQIRNTQTQDCSIAITSISSPSASSLLVQWSTYSEATNYILDLRVVNMTGVAPVVVSVSASTSQKEVFGLKPGTVYTVVLKVFRFFSVACSDTKTAKTVPDTSQIITSRAISSTAFTLEWDRVSSADQYFVLVNSTIANERYNLSFTSTSAVIQNLRPTTSYDCYVFTSNSAGLGARSRVRTVTTLVPPPVVVTVVPLSTQAVHVQWQAVDKVLLYKVTVTDSKGTLLLSTTVSSTFLDVQNLIPCRLQIITVASMNMFLDAGEPKQVNYTSNTLNAVSSVSTDYSCVSASAMVSWGAVFGAEFYRVTAVDQKGRTVSCTSTGTTCQLANLSCGKDYVVRVSAIANNCENASSATAFFQTVPCPPDNLNLYRECISNVIIFSWAPTNNTVFYKANMIDSTGGSQACITTDTSCFFTDTVCGRSYNFTVFGVNGDCSGPLSQAVSIRTAPCIPSNLITVSNCKSDVLMSSWDAVDGVSQFIVEGRGNRGNASYVSYYSCASNKSSCAIPGVACGESLTMMITAFNDDCYSEAVLGQETNTAPCVPQTLSPINDCSSDSITLTWSTANGALFYIASVTDSLGGQYSCSTSNLNCQITGLRCGTTYNATIISSNYKCNSSVSNNITVNTAPCPPNQVQATLDCEGNRALVSWLKSQFPGSYTATMVDQSGGQLNCSTVNSSCWIPSLKCGQAYNVSITYHNNICRSKTSSPISINSIPCGPENFHSSLECSSGAVQLTWDPTYGANGYSASVVAASSGRRMFCNSTFPNCSLSSLTCGESYVAQVRSYNGSCFSMLSQTVTFKGVPCAPTNVTVARTCTNRTTVMWQASLGAQSYRVIAVSNQGKQSTCSSNTTTCSLIDLQCGQVYNVSVVAIDETCSSIHSQSATLQTGPCAPFNIHSTIQCITNIVTLSWDSSPTSMSYTGRAVGADGSIILCNSSSAQCQFMDLRCGLNYAIKLIASDGMCWSAESETYTQPTGPCAPVTVSNFLNCDTNMLSVSWTPSPLALSYSALLTPINGLVRGCTSDATNCVISGLQCGLSYSLTVLAANRVCTGPQSQSQTIQAAPCIPASVSANVVCASNTVHAAWAQAVGALSYTGILTSADGVTRSCSTSALSCEFSGLSCAKTYTVQVLANSNCNSSASTSVTVTTGPCDPSNMSAQVQCGSGAVKVSWQASAGASAYTAQAYLQNQTVPSDSCSSPNTTCSLTHLQCGTLYYVSVFASDGTCSSSPVGRTTVRTAPCPPVLQVVPSSCINDQALVLWTGSPDVLDVTVTATSVLGYSAGCTSANNSCNIQGLQCAQKYTLQGTSHGMLCNSTPSVPLNINTAPCPPAAIRANYTCGTSMAVVSWNDSLGRENFIARIQTQDQFDSCNTNLTRCTFSSLLCGRLYNVSLLAVAGQCNSSNIARTQMQTAPCAPQNVSVSLQCGNNTASVNWAPSLGAIGYDVTALGRDGDVKYCRTSNTYCQIPNLHCSQTYNFVVTPFSDVCTGWPSSTFTFTAGPCAPTGVQASLLCQNNVGVVSWIAAINAEKYIAIATSSDGFRHNCTTNGTSCQFLDLYCGKNYNITVVSVQGACWSDPSTPVPLRSAGCPPSNLVGVTQCGTNDITFTWDPSSRLGVTYFLFSQQENLANSTFNTTATFITLKHLQCGVLLTMRVAAQDNNCLSQYSAPVQIRTAPCAPSGLVATTSCGTSQATLSWLGGVGALFYTATLVSNDGGSISCTSNTNTCLVKLDCDSIYTVTVISSTGLCNSTTNSSTQLTSAPCLISNVTTQLNCTANSLAVQWISISGNKTYSALAIGNDGTHTSCNTNGTSCTIPGLRCGRSYGIAVTTLHSQCTVQTSDFQIQTAPCKSENLSVSLECNTSIATVWWNSTGLDQSYSVSAVNFTGGAVMCSTNTTHCTYNQFQCGETYTVTVTGITQRCFSQPSTSVDFSTAPCTPTHVKATYDCDTSITVVMWDIARGAENYIVYAVSNQGYSTNFSTVDTTCNLRDLRCGQVYSITVVAERGGCRSQPSQPFTVSTGPCPQSSPYVSLDCSINSALVSWTHGYGILYYNVSADAIDVDSFVTCSTTGTSCNVTQLQCAQPYQISVTGQGSTCPSPAQGWVAITSGPCPPRIVSAQVPCGSNVMTISWQISQGSVSYLAVAQSSGGQWFNCSSSGTTCDIPGLQCGQSYEVFVSGVVGTCIGPKSQSQIVKTTPCVPQNVQAILACQSTVLNVTWQQFGEATQFRGIVETTAGQVPFPVTGRTFFTVPNILCGLTYNVTVVAQNDKCNSSRSSVQSAISAPCPPQAISATINCTSNTILVNWSSSVVGASYMVQAVSSNSYYTCNSSSTFCSIHVPCGKTYNISVTPSQNGCTGVSSSSITIQSAPCVPTLTNVEMDCLYNSAWVMWNASSGAESYTAVATDSDGLRYQCNSSNSICTISGLQCGRNYSYGLTATNARCSSGVSNTMQVETVPCPPSNVNVSVNCESGTVTVQWLRSVGALAYTATLEPLEGNSSCCTALNGSTSCDVASLPCGQSYMVTVTAAGRTCNSSQSMAILVQTAPCQPMHPNATVSCTDNVANVRWINSMGGQLYTVTAVSVNGTATDSCSGFDGSCNLRGLACGLQYTASVVAQHSSCRSLPSPTTLIKTVPCAPQNVKLTLDCNARNLTISWNKTSGGQVYTATLRNSLGYATTCQSLTDQCTISGLSCGTAYHTSVIASDTSCSSQPSIIQDTDPIPCAPSNIRAQMDIQASTAVLSWYFGAGSLRYKAIAVSSFEGTSVSCDTNQTNCNLINLLCGDKYNVTIQAVGNFCNKSASMGQYLQTGPCVPRLVSASYTPPVALLLWDMTRGADNYTAQAVSQHGSQASCSTRDTSCVLYSLNCSQTYNITLTAYNNIYQDGVKSNTLTLNTEPCPPTILTTRVVGDQGEVTWEPSIGAVRYTVMLEGRRGDTLYCQSTDTSCSVAGLLCGTVYVSRVTAIGTSINSSISVGALLTTVPCLPDPNSFAVTVQCPNNSASVSWAWSDGATSYELTATSNNGDQLKCVTGLNTCNITNLECGQTYNLSLTTINSAGAASLETGITFQSRPCVPKYVGANLQCGTRTAVLNWERKPGVLYYLGSATFSPKVAAVMCNSTTDSCSFSGLQCGVQYTLSVIAYTRQCWSDFSAPVNITTEPCPVQNLTVTGSCNTSSLQLNWSNVTGAQLYTISVTGNLGYTTAFQSPVPSLQVEVPCGQSYSFSVLGKNDQCYSLTSTTAKFSTAPCAPTAVQTFIQCEDNIASVSWVNSDGALNYTAVAKGQTLGQTSICTTNTTICNWSDLLCGELYTVRVTASNLYCSSAPSDNTTIRMAPCIPKILSANFDCGLRVASLTWEASRGTQSYLMTAENDISPMVGLTTNTTNAQISELHCGQQYYFKVSTVGQGCRSKPSNSSVLQTEPCPPTAVATSVDCLSNIATVTWGISSTADHYITNVVGPDSIVTTCMSSTTSCGIATLQCGQKYNVSVTASRLLCNSKPSVTTYLNTGPCAPLNLSVSISCGNNAATLFWSPGNGSMWYYASATNAQGDNRHCNTTGTSCIIAGLQCGAVYNFTVHGSDGVCNSSYSRVVQKAAAPCAQQSLNVSFSCGNNTATLSWSPNNGSLWYYASAITALGVNRQCNTTATSCTIAGLQCGTLYNFSVQGSDGVCNSSSSTTVQKATGPCAPQSLNVSFSCGNNTATLSWSPSNGSLLYYASAVSAQGDSRQCNATGTSCTIAGLQCGTLYNFSVQGSDGVCNSSNGPVVPKITSPCASQSLNVSFSCGNNTATLSWPPSNGSLWYYGSAITALGDNRQCNTTGTSCAIAGLQCGTLYNFSVQGSDGVCSSPRNPVVRNVTAPCAPQSLNVSLSCENNTATLSWSPSNGSLWYYASAITALGVNRQCNTTASSCTIAGLQCGTLYNFSVQGSDGVCNSSSSPTVQKATAPCTPQSLNVSLSCENNTATVSWSSSNGSLGYYAPAVNAQGDIRQCNSTGTSCSIAGLQCGIVYNFTVQATNGVCNSSRSSEVQKKSAPCSPQSPNVSFSSGNNTATLSWTSSNGSLWYYASAVNAPGDNRQCNATRTPCIIEGLQCGILYNFSVQGSDGVCNSSHNPVLQKITCPCAPQSLNVSFSCGNNTATLSWSPSNGSLLYYASAVSAQGDSRQCTATGTSCTIAGLQCGTLYNFSVQGSDGVCNSSNSPVVPKITSPCAPQSLNVSFSCGNNTATLSWASSNGSLLYYASAVSARGDSRQCNATGTSCTIAGLQCGTLYNFSVLGSDGVCNSSNSPVVPKITTPCASQSLNVSFSCGNNTATLSWSPSNGLPWYYASAITALGDNHQCNTTGTSCAIAGLQCGTLYSFSVQVSDGVCNSPSSPVVQRGAVPCPPDVIKNVNRQLENDTLVLLNWIPVNCTAVQYLVGLNGTFLNGDLVQLESYWTERTYFEFPLPCGISYSVVVTARSGAITGEPSVPIYGSTGVCQQNNTTNTGSVMGRRRRDLGEGETLAGLNDEGVLPVPKVKDVHLEGLTLYVKWAPVTGAIHYMLIVKEDPEYQPSEAVTVQNEVAEVPNLKPATRYCVTVAAKSSINQSAYSAPICLTTGIPIVNHENLHA